MVVCRAATEAGPLVAALAELGAEPVAVPLLARTAPADDGEALAAAVARLEAYSWVALTSINGVRSFVEALRAASAGPAPDPASGSDPGRRLPSVAAVGPSTATALEAAGLVVALVPAEATAAGLARAFPPPPPGRCRVLAPLAEAASDDLERGLTAAGWVVDRVDAYRMVEPPVADDEADRQARAVGRAHAALLTSPSVVDRFVDRFGATGLPPTTITIGPRTTARAIGRDLGSIIEADRPSDAGLIEALLATLG